jgi:hypothetical protein
MIHRFTFREEEIRLSDGRVLRKQRCADGPECLGHGWISDDHMTVQVSTDEAGPGVKFLHFSVSYEKKRTPSAAEVRMVREQLRELRACRMVDEPLVFVRNNVVQCLEITPLIELVYGRPVPMGARQFEMSA